jgi:hypothetical protein
MTCVFADPSREPVLERAMPADAVPGSTIPEDSEAEILLRDGTWVWAQVIGQRKDRHNRWCVGVRWYASPAVGGREGWYLYDPRLIRRPPLTRAAVARGVRLRRRRVQIPAVPRSPVVVSGVAVVNPAKLRRPRLRRAVVRTREAAVAGQAQAG